MPIGGSGVAPAQIQGGDKLIDLISLLGDPAAYQKRYEALEAIIAKADADKKSAAQIVRKANADAKEQSDRIIKDAEEQAQDRLDAVHDLETKMNADKAAWEEEKSSEQAKIRSERSRLAASTTSAKKAKEAADAAKKDLDGEIAQTHEARQAFTAAVTATRELWKGLA